MVHNVSQPSLAFFIETLSQLYSVTVLQLEILFHFCSVLPGSKSARRLIFSRPQKEQGTSSFYSRTAAARRPFNPVDMNDLYIPDSPERTMNENTMTWQPGETLPVSRRPGPQPFSAEAQPSQSTSMSDIQIMLQSMQSSIEKSFDDVKGRLSDLEARMTGVEEKQREVVNIRIHLLRPLQKMSSVVNDEALLSFRYAHSGAHLTHKCVNQCCSCSMKFERCMGL